MKWYSGGIAEAIKYSKSKGAVFVIYIEGTDDISQKITDLIDNGELGQKLEQDYFVAIKLEGGSTAYQQFSEIFKEPSTPSIYFIGKNGVPLDIITGGDNLDNLCQRIDNTLITAGIHTPSVSSVPASVLCDNFIKNELAANSKVVCDNDVLKIVHNDEGTSSGLLLNEDKEQEEKQHKTEEKEIESPKEITAEEKVQRAKELLELKKQEKETEEKENERLKELERRKMGQNVQQLKKWQEDQELKQLKEERDREKRENQEARDRVLAQIAQDRAERLSKSQSNSPQAAETSKPTSQSPPKVLPNKTRLQFKLPDGSSTTNEFENSDTLENVIYYIRSTLPLPFNNFTLSTVFPRREFTKNDYSQTLVDLQLCPTAVVLILPQSSGPVVDGRGILPALMWSLLAPIISVFEYIRYLVFGHNPIARTPKRPSPDEPTESQRYSSPKRKSSDGSSVVKRQGNIHRLSDKSDSDDENNTWNGNSTQQM